MVSVKAGLDICDQHGAQVVAVEDRANRRVQKNTLRNYSLPLLAFAGIMMFSMLITPASAESLIDVTNITDTLISIGENLFGGILAIVVGAWPVVLIIAIIGFVGKFLDRILEMLKL